jgi:inosine-uridine nucleoside N-ribohydrolase
MKIARFFLALAGLVLGIAGVGAQTPVAVPAPAPWPQFVLLDTDIGDDLDDAFALALAYDSPEMSLLGVTTTYGDTDLRAKLLDRFLNAVGRSDIPVTAGIATPQSNGFTQAAYAKQAGIAYVDACQMHLLVQSQSPTPKRVQDEFDACEKDRHDAAGSMLRKISDSPKKTLTLIAIGPLNNIEEAIRRDPATFRKVGRVVVMSGSIERGYDGPQGEHQPAEAEWNASRDPAGLRLLLASGVPVYLMPLDATQIRLESAERETIFAHGSPLTDQLTLLYHQWMAGTEGHPAAPTLYDVVAVAYALRPELCPVKPMRLEVDEQGLTKVVEGEPNAQVCQKADEAGVLKLLLDRVAGPAAR